MAETIPQSRQGPLFTISADALVTQSVRSSAFMLLHDDVIKWKHFPRYWPFVQGIQRSPVNSPHKGQWRGALMFSLICVWINGWVNNREAGDLRRYRAHYDVTVMTKFSEYSDIIIRTVTCGCWKISNGKNWTKICRATSRYWSVIEHNWYVMAALDHNHYVYIDREIYTLHIHWSQLFKYTHTHINI